MSDRFEILERWAQKRTIGKPFKETAHVYERLNEAASNIAEMETTSERVTLRFFGGTPISAAAAAMFDVQWASDLPVVARFNGVEISMIRVDP